MSGEQVGGWDLANLLTTDDERDDIPTGKDLLGAVCSRGGGRRGRWFGIDLDELFVHVQDPVDGDARFRVHAALIGAVEFQRARGRFDEEGDVGRARVRVNVSICGVEDDGEVWFRLAICQSNGRLNTYAPLTGEYGPQSVLCFVDRHVVWWVAGHLGDDPPFNELEPFIGSEEPLVDQTVVFVDGELSHPGARREQRQLRGGRDERRNHPGHGIHSIADGSAVGGGIDMIGGMRIFGVAAVVFSALGACVSASAERPRFPPPLVVPEALGVNIHFTDPKPGEMEMLAGAGFRWVRMDFNWGGTERKAGEYDFGAYDRLMAALEPQGVRPVFILDYSNRLYDGGVSPASDEGRAAFAKWAAAAAKHFVGRGVVWEMYNEPNIGFWKPKPDVEAYAKLAVAVGKALREAAPNETYVGPATSTIDLNFIEACFKAGCLEYWSAVSVHPYRQSNPETAAGDYQKLRMLIARYAPAGKRVPILSGEWGYSSAWQKFDEEKQGRYLPRELLTNLWQEVPVSIWYDWHDDGTDAKEPEHHFGTVHNAYRKGEAEVYEPKPAYRAMRTLKEQLGGYAYSKRLMLEDPERLMLADPRDFVLLFRKGQDVKLVAWTTAAEGRKVTLPAGAGEFDVVGHLGEAKGRVTAGARGIEVTLTGEVQYFTPIGPNKLLVEAAEWERLPLDVFVHGPTTVRVGTTEASIARTAAPQIVGETRVEAGGVRLSQETAVVATNPLIVMVLPLSGQTLAVRVQDPSGEGLRGRVTLTGLSGLEVERASQPVVLKAGEAETTVRFTGKANGPAYVVGAELADEQGKALTSALPQLFGGLPDFGEEGAYRLEKDGDKKVASSESLTRDTPLEAAPEPGMGVAKLAYKSDAGWRFWQVKPAKEENRKISGQPRALGIWVWGSGKNELPRLRFVDATGQTFQAAGETIDWHGWKYVTIPMDQASVAHSHWGGANDGVVHYPIKWDTVFLLDRDSKKAAEGAVYLAGATLIR